MDRYCCGKGSGGTWSGVRCKNKPSPQFEHEGKSYCATHYPPNVAERKRKRREKRDAESKAWSDHLNAVAVKQMEDRAKLADYERLVKENEDLRAELERWKEVSRDEH